MFKIANPDSVVFVMLSINGKARSLPLLPNDERVLVVGSTARAEFRVSGAGVAPIQFHFERYEGGVWLIPAYGSASLRMNGVPVAGPTPLEQYNEIDFCDVHIEAGIIEAKNFDAESNNHALGIGEKEEFPSPYSSGLPSVDDVTSVAMRPIPAGNELDEYPTTVFERKSPHDGDEQPERVAPHERPITSAETESSSPVQTAQQLVPIPPATSYGNKALPAYTPNGTEIMAPYRPMVPVAASAMPTVTPSVSDTLRIVPMSDTPAHPTNRWHPPAPPELQRPSTLPMSTAIVALSSSPPPIVRHQFEATATHFDKASTDKTERRVTREQPVSFGTAKTSWLTQLGLAAKARPLAATAATIGIGVLLAFLLFVGSRIAQRHRVTAVSPRELTPTLHSLRPAQEGPSAIATPLLSVDEASIAKPVRLDASPSPSNPERIIVSPARQKAEY